MVASDAALQQVKGLQAQLSASTDLNPLSELLALGKAAHQRVAAGADETPLVKAVHLAVRVVARSLVALCEQGRLDVARCDDAGYLRAPGAATDPAAQVAQWLGEQYNELVAFLHETLLFSPDVRLRSAAVEVSMLLQTATSEALARADDGAEGGRWSPSPFRVLMAAVLLQDVEADVLDKLADDYLEAYDDVRYMVCREIARTLRNARAGDRRLRSRALSILRRITAIPTEDEHLNTYLVPHLGVWTKKSGKKRKAAASARRIAEDGESDEEVPDEPPVLFSESEDEEEQAPAPATAGGRRRSRAQPLRAALHSLAAQRHAFAAAWLTLLLPGRAADGTPLGGPLSRAETHDILVRLHAQVLPHLPKPALLHDFLVDCLDGGATSALLALNGLFTLIVAHNLDYPAFYTRLYALLDANVLHTKYRSRFMRMLDKFLSSTHLPAALVASFLKRLSRLSLRAPPAAIVEIVPFVWNLLRRHTNCMRMIHREYEGDHLALGPVGVHDGFNATEPDPMHTGALDSSLWEIAAFGAYHHARFAQHSDSAGGSAGGDTHYLGSVTTFARILAEPFTQQRYELEEFLDTTYATLFETEVNKTLKRKERPGKAPPPPPAVAELDLALSVPALVATKSQNVDQALRRETRKRLRSYAFPEAKTSASRPSEDPVVQSRQAMPLDAPARLWDVA